MSINPIFVILYIILYIGEEQLSLGVHFVDTTNKEPTICDEYRGFTSLAQIDAETIANMPSVQSSE